VRQNPKLFEREIKDIQDRASLDRQISTLGQKRRTLRVGQFTLHCLSCDHYICVSEDVKKIEMAHHVIIDETLDQRVDFTDRQTSQVIDQTTQFCGKMVCKGCGRNLGVICIYKGMDFPVPKIENFLVKDINGRQDMYTKWKKVPFNVSGLETEDLRKILQSKAPTVGQQ